MQLTKADIGQLLRLKSSELVADEIASRQTEVIRKAYNYLIASGDHPIVYIADEVGLGKTYIALGIAMLFRHFSENPLFHRDLVIVPKANLQVKWQNEAVKFLKNNYLPTSKDRLLPLFNFEMQKLRLEAIPTQAAMTIFRMTSFSALLARGRWERDSSLKEKLRTILNGSPIAIGLLDNYWDGCHDDITLRKFAAYLLNIATGKVDTLIVDEAHNYKHGLGSSNRNTATAYFLGAVRDEGLLERFPRLKERVSFPLATKTICLSATPKDRRLQEIGQQLDCFLPKHPLQHVEERDYIGKLKSFLIRGNMTYQLNGSDTSRHACRQEHRKGNVEKSHDAEVLEVRDDFTGAFWQLLQYQSIRHLCEKGNATFEMGMLAGFETYQLDAQKRYKNTHTATTDREEMQEGEQSEGEYEEPNTRQSKESEDKAVIEMLMNGYLRKFGELPPHPKQTPLEEELLRQMMSQQKALVFVRRVHTAIELNARLLRRYEGEMAKKLRFEKPFKQFNTKGVKDILAEYEMREKRSDLEAFFKNRLCQRVKLGWFQQRDEHEQSDYCLYAYKHNEGFKSEVDRLLDKQRLHLSDGFWRFFSRPQKEWEAARLEETDVDTPEETDELEQAYFFNQYFSTGKPIKFKIGNNFRRRMSKKKLFELPENMDDVDDGFLSRLLHETLKKAFERWKKRSVMEENDWNLLRSLVQGIFRNGSGLLPAFVADSARRDFAVDLSTLLAPGAPFHYVSEEVCTILLDFDLIKSVNFSEYSPDKMIAFFKGLSPVTGRTGQTGGDRSRIAAQFRMPGFPYILVATDIFREGEDLHTYCQNVYHYGIAWNPSDMEQRTGRIDRINSQSYRKLTQVGVRKTNFEDKIHVFYPYLQKSVEVNQVFQLFHNINHFMETFNEIEQAAKRDSRVSVENPVSGEPPRPIIPQKGKFEVDDFNES